MAPPVPGDSLLASRRNMIRFPGSRALALHRGLTLHLSLDLRLRLDLGLDPLLHVGDALRGGHLLARHVDAAAELGSVRDGDARRVDVTREASRVRDLDL